MPRRDALACKSGPSESLWETALGESRTSCVQRHASATRASCRRRLRSSLVSRRGPSRTSSPPSTPSGKSPSADLGDPLNPAARSALAPARKPRLVDRRVQREDLRARALMPVGSRTIGTPCATEHTARSRTAKPWRVALAGPDDEPPILLRDLVPNAAQAVRKRRRIQAASSPSRGACSRSRAEAGRPRAAAARPASSVTRKSSPSSLRSTGRRCSRRRSRRGRRAHGRRRRGRRAPSDLRRASRRPRQARPRRAGRARPARAPCSGPSAA